MVRAAGLGIEAGCLYHIDDLVSRVSQQHASDLRQRQTFAKAYADFEEFVSRMIVDAKAKRCSSLHEDTFFADSNYRLCSVLAGQDPPMDVGIERDKHTKADLTRALGESFAYCDKQYSAMTDAVGTPIVMFDTGGEGSRVPVQMPRLTVLAFHTAHAFEHYGNLVTYMRLKGIVPPSSEPPFGTYKPPQ
jgi:hypothetical protein